MGTEITLAVGGMDVDCSKNHRGNDHGSLFQERDQTQVRTGQTDYAHDGDFDDDELAAMEAALVRKLSDVVPRLELLGYTLATAKAEYSLALERWAEETFDGTPRKKPLTFSKFMAFATRTPVAELSGRYDSNLDDEEMKGRFAGLKEIDRVPHVDLWDRDHYSEMSYFANVIGFFHPYSILRILAENPANLDLDVTWQYGPLVDNGYAEAKEFVADSRRRERFLVATEGSSDVHILRHGFELLRPGVSDFFHFADVSEGHPFSGTGQLRKFAEGLAKIDVQNQTIFVFDNDAEGVEAARKVEAMKLPRNMRAMVLPDRNELKRPRRRNRDLSRSQSWRTSASSGYVEQLQEGSRALAWRARLQRELCPVFYGPVCDDAPFVRL